MVSSCETILICCRLTGSRSFSVVSHDHDFWCHPAIPSLFVVSQDRDHLVSCRMIMISGVILLSLSSCYTILIVVSQDCDHLLWSARSMAVLHLDVLAWRGKDLRCVGSSVLVGVFFIWAFFFVALRPSHPTTTTSQQSAESSGLSQQKTIREQTDIAENITISTNASDDSALGTGRDDEDDAPHRRKGNDKDSEKTPSKAARKANRQDSPKHSRRDPTAGSQQGTPRTRNEEEAGETDEDTSHPGTSKEPRQKKGGMTDSGGREARPKPRLAADPTAHHTLPQTPLTPAPDLLASSRFDTPVTDLEHMPVKPFSSPFVESEDEDSLAKAEKKIITWYRPTNTRDVNRAKKILKECPEPRFVDSTYVSPLFVYFYFG